MTESFQSSLECFTNSIYSHIHTSLEQQSRTIKIQTNVAHTQQILLLSPGSAEKLKYSHAVSMLPIPSLHSAICQGQLFHRRGKEIWAITMFEQQDSGEMRKLKCGSQV